MEWIAGALLALLLLGLVALAGAGVRALSPWHLVRAKRVVVNLRSGQAVEGLLVRQSGPLLFLAEAQLFEGNNNPVPIDGQAVIERPTVDFIQIL